MAADRSPETMATTLAHLERHLFAAADILRDKMDASEFKKYISGSLDLSLPPLFIDRRINDTVVARARVQEDDVMMNIVGPPLGNVFVVPAGEQLCNVNQAIAVFRAANLVSSGFLSAWLLSGAKRWFRG